jgi:hypothetical protein
MTLAGHRGDVARLKIRHRRKPNFGHLRRFHPRTKGVGLRLRHGFQEAFDGLASDDLAVTREHPIRNVSVLKLDEIAFSFSRQIVWHAVDPSRIAAVREPPYGADPDVLRQRTSQTITRRREAHFEVVAGLRRFPGLIGGPECWKRGARLRNRGGDVVVGGGNVHHRRDAHSRIPIGIRHSQPMSVLPRQLRSRCSLCYGILLPIIDTADADSTMVDVKHDLPRLLRVHFEQCLKQIAYELHGRVLVVPH